VTQRAARVDGTAPGRSEPQCGASRGAWAQSGDELCEVRTFGCGEFGDVPVPQYLGVVRRDAQSWRIPTAVGGAGGIQRSDAGAPRMLPAVRCTGQNRWPEPVLEHQVVATDVIWVAAQGRATGPVHLPGFAQIDLTQGPSERFDGVCRDR